MLKLLQKSYSGRVKLIYIDPPYNTGKDFVYPDDFRDNISNYLELTGQVEGGRKISSNTDASGRFHTDWLNMMLPRLRLARSLLRDDGVIAISIDDAEIANLRELLSEVFGMENFVANITWEKGRKNDAKLFSAGHEYLVIFAKSLARLRENKTIWREEKPGAREIWKSTWSFGVSTKQTTVQSNAIFNNGTPTSPKAILLKSGVGISASIAMARGVTATFRGLEVVAQNMRLFIP